MPYIKQEAREDVDYCSVASNSGELNYLITRLLIYYLANHHLTYQRITDCFGALEGAKLEFYRRIVVPYEEKKIEENGDVY